MKSENNNKLEISLSMLFLLLICFITIINDIIIYFTRINYNISLLISLLMVIFFYIANKKKIKITNNFNKLDIIPIIFYTVLFLVIVQYKDDFLDTITYHLYNQRNPFIDKINFDFLPLSTYFFPLAERMNFIFVNFLGYRYGTFLSLYIIFVLYYQVKRIFGFIIPNINNKRLCIYSSLVIFSLTSNLLMGKFFIDNFSIVFLLEIILIFFKNNNIFEDKKYLYYMAILSGISIGIKLSNLILVFVINIFIVGNCIFTYGGKQLKKVKVYDYVFLLIVFLFPSFIYMYNNFIQTKNPIFPFYNYIFKSIYFNKISGTDPRLGSNNLIETILWPLFICVFPLRGDDIFGIEDIIWGVGFIASIGMLFSNKNKIPFKFALLNIVLTYSWVVFIFGYTRYGMVIAILYYILTLYMLDMLIEDVKKKIKDNKISVKTVIKTILMYIIGICIIISMCQSIAYNIVRIYRMIISKNDISNKTKIVEKYDIDGAWVCTKYNTSYIDLIRCNEDPMYSMDIILDEDPMCHVNYGFSDYSKKQFLNKINNKELYTIIPYNYEEYVLEVLDRLNFKIIDELGVFSNDYFLNEYNTLRIVKIEYNP